MSSFQGAALFETNRAWLDEQLAALPVCEPADLAQAGLDTGENLDRAAVLERIAADWRAYPSQQDDGSMWADAVIEAGVLTITFSFFLWSITSEQGRISVARVGADAYRYCAK